METSTGYGIREYVMLAGFLLGCSVIIVAGVVALINPYRFVRLPMMMRGPLTERDLEKRSTRIETRLAGALGAAIGAYMFSAGFTALLVNLGLID